jgi:hypothetical protein
MAKEKEKLEKKRLKARAKIEKAKAKKAPETRIEKSTVHIHKGEVKKEVPWYKNPGWIRAIIAIIALIVAIIGVLLSRR